MTRILIRSAVLLGLGLTLTACAQHNPAQANCFNFRGANTQAETATATVSTKGTDVIRPDSACAFVMLEPGN